jgi:hypothetical protein
MSGSSTPPSATVGAEKVDKTEYVERIHTAERVPGHDNYYEKNGLRTYGDGEDHDVEPTVCYLFSLSTGSPLQCCLSVLTRLSARCPSVE